MTTRRIRDEFAGTLGVLKVGQHTVRQVISRAIEEEALLPRKGKHGDDLHLPEGE